MFHLNLVEGGQTKFKGRQMGADWQVLIAPLLGVRIVTRQRELRKVIAAG